VARQRGTSGRRVRNDGGSGAVGARDEPGAGAEAEAEGEQEAEAEAEGEAGGVPLTEAAFCNWSHHSPHSNEATINWDQLDMKSRGPGRHGSSGAAINKNVKDLGSVNFLK